MATAKTWQSITVKRYYGLKGLWFLQHLSVVDVNSLKLMYNEIQHFNLNVMV